MRSLACVLAVLASVACGYSPNYGDGQLTCGAGGACPTGLRCDPVSSRCVSADLSKLPNGQPCAAGDECQSDACVDSVCCESACEGQCEACSGAGACLPVSGAAPRTACAGEGDCKGFCDGAQRDACTFPTTECRAGSCTDGVTIEAASCALGSCPAEQTTVCDTTSDKICGATGCTTITQLTSAYLFYCALTADGTVWCWGNNFKGTLGQGDDETEHRRPVKVQGLANVKQLGRGFGGLHMCAILNDNTVRCWGSNRKGALGLGAVDDGVHGIPVPVVTDAGTPFNNVRAVSMGFDYTCAIKNDDTIWCWGSDSLGQLADGAQSSTRMVSTPTKVLPAGALGTKLSVGYAHACISVGTSDTAKVSCWGQNGNGETGQTPGGSTLFVAETGFVNLAGGLAEPLIAGNAMTCGIASNAGVPWCWGWNDYGQLGRGATSSGPNQQPAPVCTSAAACATTGQLSQISQVVVGYNHACGLGFDGVVRCWGSNDYGQYGDGMASGYGVPYAAYGPSLPGLAVQLAATHSTTCVLVNDGNVYCMGENSDGECGTGGAETSYNTPQRVNF
jgi:alpha-tubulin suppressor-like RCC1 family protein